MLLYHNGFPYVGTSYCTKVSKHGWHICLTFNPLQMNFSKITIRPKRPQKYINIFYPALCFASKHSSRQYRLEKTKKPLSGDVKKKKKIDVWNGVKKYLNRPATNRALLSKTDRCVTEFARCGVLWRRKRLSVAQNKKGAIISEEGFFFLYYYWQASHLIHSVHKCMSTS